MKVFFLLFSLISFGCSNVIESCFQNAKNHQGYKQWTEFNDLKFPLQDRHYGNQIRDVVFERGLIEKKSYYYIFKYHMKNGFFPDSSALKEQFIRTVEFYFRFLKEEDWPGTVSCYLDEDVGGIFLRAEKGHAIDSDLLKFKKRPERLNFYLGLTNSLLRIEQIGWTLSRMTLSFFTYELDSKYKVFPMALYTMYPVGKPVFTEWGMNPKLLAETNEENRGNKNVSTKPMMRYYNSHPDWNSWSLLKFMDDIEKKRYESDIRSKNIKHVNNPSIIFDLRDFLAENLDIANPPSLKTIQKLLISLIEERSRSQPQNPSRSPSKTPPQSPFKISSKNLFENIFQTTASSLKPILTKKNSF